LDPRITYTRAGPATYTDSAGTIQTAAINTPRWDYDPITHVLCGLLIEEARTNIWLQSADASNAAWSKSPGIAPTVTGNQAIAPDGTLSAARVAMPAVSGAGSFCNIYQNFTTAVAAYSLSVWLRGTVGGERLWLSTTPDGVLYYRTAVTLTTAWQRVSLTTPNLTAVPWFFGIGVDLRDAGETAQGAQTFHVWGGQVELGGFVTSYIPTTSAPVVRAQDQCGILSASMSPWFTTAGTWMAEWIFIDPAPTGRRILGAATASGTGSVAPLTAGNAPFPLGSWDGVSYFETTNNTTSNVVQKGANASSGAVQPVKLCLNGGPIANLASSTNGFASLATTGVRFLQNVAGVSTDNGNGYIRRVQFWPRVLTNTEMQTVTT
jgi:hypothetical protein